MSWRIPAVLALLVLAGGAFAQSPATKGGEPRQPNAFEGFSQDSNEPVTIEADSLEIHDKDSYAVFIGNVVVTQGESVMRSRELKVYYEGSMRDAQGGGQGGGQGGNKAAPASVKASADDPAQRIRRLEALGGVIVTSKDQKATGDSGIFDMRSNTATITGNVVISQGPNVMRADRLIVDMRTGFSRMEAGTKAGGGRVQGLFLPSTVQKQKSPARK